jgi:hypothetical protein
MKRFDVRDIGAILLIVAGALILLQNFGILGIVVTLIWALVFAAGGLVFLYLFMTERNRYWWGVIPGLGLLGLAILILLDEFFPGVGADLGGMIFLGALALAFWMIYFRKREFWWAIIPGGVLCTLALVTIVSSILGGGWAGGAFFVGLGLTFGLLYLVPTPHGRMKWAIFPAAALLVMGLLITAATTGALDFLFAIALIVVGLYLLFRLFVSRQGG